MPIKPRFYQREKGECMKKLLSILVIICLAFTLFGCAKCINTEYRDVEVTVVDKHYKASHTKVEYNVPLKMPMTKRVPAVYRITVEYDGANYMIDEVDTYNKYKDLVGQTTIGTLETSTYDNGTTRKRIIKLR